MSRTTERRPADDAATYSLHCDPSEAGEWMDALDELLDRRGPESCCALLRQLLERAGRRGVGPVAPRTTPYRNTIPLSEQPDYPGDLAVERRITAIVRWNAMAMVIRANRAHPELGGHVSTYASAADLFEVAFHHFLRGHPPESAGGGAADLVFFQPHSAPGIYARAFLEGRLSEDHLLNYRRENGGTGLCSYPHPRAMPDFWEFPTGSMGLNALTAIYQARFMRYLENRGLVRTAGRKVWAFLGDGEMDEPESTAGLTLASRELLDNLIFVVNCNLQRLDGPVRGNGSIIQELESLFAGAGWNVIKVLWGSDWDDLFARDRRGVLLERLHETVDGELQTYAAKDGRFNRERFFGKYPELQELVLHLTDSQIDNLTRGGHDPVKIYAAYDAAVRHKGRPTVVLAQTKKGYSLGRWAQGRMSAHQQKKLDEEALRWFRDRFDLPLSDEEIAGVRFCRLPESSPEMRYLRECRRRLGGYLPCRKHSAPALPAPGAAVFAPFVFEPESREMSTTVAFVRMLTRLLKEPLLGRRVVPIVADEARTFGMEALFRRVGIYSHCGQLYEPEDQQNLMYYRESRDGQILEEGINEAGAMASWIAAGTAYSHHGLALLPFYIFYSMFGFQRVGDLIWAAADSRARGFLMGATAGRTTLSGEGLQHEDGASHLLASTIPACRAYDPCYAYELAVILQHGMKALLERQEDAFYYVTLMNENYAHGPMPAGAEAGILRGLYRLRETACPPPRPRVQLLASGVILREALAAAELLEADWETGADVWSVTSFTELRRGGMAVTRSNRHGGKRELSWVEQCLGCTSGPMIAASDYVSAVPDLIRAWVPRRYIVLGTDGFGRSDTRAALRTFFEVDRHSMVLAALAALADEGTIPRARVAECMRRYDCVPAACPPWER
ncbi:MAG: pyruvate dehydrogenase (acetyl-transferring), homodimeric type [Bryobacterales bacterium]|nr:pyruvate dehydrogenase (acetyl-transferring), homodimeric type [Bryobacterales bacterium]